MPRQMQMQMSMSDGQFEGRTIDASREEVESWGGRLCGRKTDCYSFDYDGCGWAAMPFGNPPEENESNRFGQKKCAKALSIPKIQDSMI